MNRISEGARATGIVAVIAIAVALVLVFRPRASAPPAAPAAPAVALATVYEGTFDVTLQEAGRVGSPAGATTNLAFAVPGIIAAVGVRVGETVRAGQPLAHLASRSYALSQQAAEADAEQAQAAYAGGAVPDAAIASARAKLHATQAQLQADETGVRREQRLYAAGILAEKAVVAAQTQVAADRSNVAVAQADLRAAQAQPHALGAAARAADARAAAATYALDQSVLRSPIDGIVTAVLKRPGEAVDSTTPVISVGPPQQHEATLTVPATDAQQIALGDRVELDIAGAGRSTGRVTAVVPSVDPQTQDATVAVSGVSAGAVAGNAVQATITVAQVSGMLIPESAIVQDPQSGENAVFVRATQKDGTVKFEQHNVSIAHENGTIALITRGVRVGDRVATQGAFSLLAPAGGS